jgi:hypothetical protein
MNFDGQLPLVHQEEVVRRLPLLHHNCMKAGPKDFGLKCLHMGFQKQA